MWGTLFSLGLGSSHWNVEHAQRHTLTRTHSENRRIKSIKPTLTVNPMWWCISVVHKHVSCLLNVFLFYSHFYLAGMRWKKTFKIPAHFCRNARIPPSHRNECVINNEVNANKHDILACSQVHGVFGLLQCQNEPEITKITFT